MGRPCRGTGKPDRPRRVARPRDSPAPPMGGGGATATGGEGAELQRARGPLTLLLGGLGGGGGAHPPPPQMVLSC